MTLLELFEKHPYDRAKHGSKEQYYAIISNMSGGTNTPGSVGARYRSIRQWQTVRQMTDKNGEIIHEVKIAVPNDEIEDLTGFEPVGLTTNPHGGQWVRYKKEQKTFEDLKDELIAEMQKHAPKYPVIKRTKIKDAHLLVVDPADIHIGKLAKAFESGDEQSNSLIVRRVIEGVEGLINKAQGFPIDKILLVIGNDILHVDNPKRTTTSGTPQDTDGMWYENFLLAKKLYVDIIEMLLSISDVRVMYNPSNHDYQSGFFLADTLATWFRHSKNVTFDVSISHRKYDVYGENVIGTTHGDGAKDSDLPLLMAQECKKWSECKHRYFYTHHIHHKKSKDYGSVCVESLRSPSGTDSWHHRNGYQHSPKAVEAFIHHKEHGQICRITHIF